jgi:hypothetical protein
MRTRRNLVNEPNIPQLDDAAGLTPVRRLSDDELQRASAGFTTPALFIAQDPYRPLDPRAQRVAYCEPSFVRGRREDRDE